jgi:hypothetical protein
MEALRIVELIPNPLWDLLIQGGSVTFKQILFGLLFVPGIASAQDTVKLNMDDISFQWRLISGGSILCGYTIEGNHHGWANPRTEWDINIDEIVQGEIRVAGVSAGSFVLTGKRRTPRPPIIDMVFTTQDDAEPLPVQFVGVPNRDNGVHGSIELGRATKLFAALSNNRRITAALRYADGSSERLQFSGFKDSRKFGGGRNSPFDECLRGRTPYPGAPGWTVRIPN